MNNIFINLYDFAVSKGLLQREPEFGQQLQSATERFLALAKANVIDDGSHEDDQVDTAKQDHPQTDSDSGRWRKDSQTSSRRPLEKRPPIQMPVQPWGGYTISKDENCLEEIQLNFQQQSYDQRSRPGDLQVISRPTEDNASFPFDFMDLQQYRVEVPLMEPIPDELFTHFQLPPPPTHSYTELSLARRIHRGAAERALALISLENPPPELLKNVFGFCGLYESKEAIKARLAGVIARSRKETLQQWREPFLHVGGAGTFYPLHESDISGDLMPKFRTGYSMGPFSPPILEASEKLHDMRCSVSGFDGEFFDPNDVEGYLRGRGLEIPPSADFVTVELDISALSDTGTAKSTGSGNAASASSPRIPGSPTSRTLLNTQNSSHNVNFNNPQGKAFPLPLGYGEWDNQVSAKRFSSIDPIFSTMSDSMPVTKYPEGSFLQRGGRRMVTINVNILIESKVLSF